MRIKGGFGRLIGNLRQAHLGGFLKRSHHESVDPIPGLRLRSDQAVRSIGDFLRLICCRLRVVFLRLDTDRDRVKG